MHLGLGRNGQTYTRAPREVTGERKRGELNPYSLAYPPSTPMRECLDWWDGVAYRVEVDREPAKLLRSKRLPGNARMKLALGSPLRYLSLPSKPRHTG